MGAKPTILLIRSTGGQARVRLITALDQLSKSLNVVEFSVGSLELCQELLGILIQAQCQWDAAAPFLI
jgi:hypothetical protein